MITTGSKLLLGAAVAGASSPPIVYGVAQGGALGTIGLIFAAARPRRSSPASTSTSATPTSRRWTRRRSPTSAAAHRAPGAEHVADRRRRSARVLVVVGLVTYPVVFIFGVIALLAATVEWMVQAWSERASADAAYNAERPRAHRPPARVPGPRRPRRRHHHLLVQPDHAVPVEDRAGRSRSASIAALVLAVGFVIAFRPTLRSAAPSSAVAVDRRARARRRRRRRRARAASARSSRTRRPATLAAEGECDTAEETDADEHASQTVAAKANVAAEVIAAERRHARRPRRSASTASPTTLVVTRANPTNILFATRASEDRRLVLDLGTRPTVDEATGDTIPDDDECRSSSARTLVEEGGSQLLTFSIADRRAGTRTTPYRFIVPGVDGAEVEVHRPVSVDGATHRGDRAVTCVATCARRR